MSTIKVVAVQSKIIWLDKAANLRHLDEILKDIVSSDLIVLPETFATGFAVRSPDCAEPSAGGEVLKWMKQTAASRSSVICGSVLVDDGANKVNRFYWVTADGKVDHYDKRHLFRMAGEDSYIKAGDERKIVLLNNFRVMLNVCYDLRFPVWSRNQQDYDLLINVANWPSPRRNAWDTLLKARAIENQAYVIGVNLVGTDDNGVKHSGGTAITDFLGKSLAIASDNKEDIIVAELAMQPLNAFRESFPFYLDADSFRVVE